MELLVNGKNLSTKNRDILSLIEELELNIDGMVVIHNDNIIKKDKYQNLILNENDRLELLNFVSGG
ncbi:MAG: sulfur carrier protein ThiS [Fusobacteriaceae bacterium]|nr:sulfur carrier protein ThiS [Fusobacteriaceae bacterium]MBP6467171.1 sulfur carrier protein ThiS [Fusobacteriaceae bacterium]MBP9596034.1 sulfur carrier protein ThiS [Fusobacteriaceae bacterium]MBU9917686.1 sulfur carrier protein ThiS [Fusobacteriaceae bacterium]